MPQILNESNFYSSIGQGAGRGVASALEASLGKLAQHKLDTVLSRAGVPGEYKSRADEFEALTAGLGGRKDIAQILMGVPANQRYSMLENLYNKNYLNQQAQQTQPGQPTQTTPQQGMPVRAQQMPEAPRRTAADLLTQKNIPDTIRQALSKSQVPQQQQQMPMQQQPQSEKAFPQVNATPPQLPSQAPQVGQGPMSLGQALFQKTPKPGAAASDPEMAELKKEKLRADIENAKREPQGKLSPDAQEFIEKTEKRAQFAGALLKNLNELEEFIDKHEKEFQSNLYGAYAPDSFLNDATKKLKQKMSKILTDMINIDSQGKGSDLMRRIIQEGKLSIQQGPDVWRQIIGELKGDTEDSLRLSEIKDEVRRAYGRTPEDIGGLSRASLDVDKAEFRALPDTEKMQYLFDNPNKMKWITEMYDETGKVVARRTKNGWKEVS